MIRTVYKIDISQLHEPFNIWYLFFFKSPLENFIDFMIAAHRKNVPTTICINEWNTKLARSPNDYVFWQEVVIENF